MYYCIKVDSQWEFLVWQGTQPGALQQPRGVGWGGGRDVQDGGDICVYMADSGWCLAEINKIL